MAFCISCGKEKTTEPTNAPVQEAQPTTTKAVDTTGLFVPVTTTRQEFLKTKKEYVEAIDTTHTISKINGEITLPIKGNRPPVVFKDSLQPKYDENIEQYHYKGRIDNPAFYLVQGDFWEWNDYYMINQYTGKKDTLWSDPVFSPDKNLIVNLSPAYGLEGDPNGIQIWKVANNNGNATLSKIKVIDQQEWIPLEVYWVDNRTLIFRAVTVANFNKVNGEPQEKDVYYFKMRVL
ncbi:hypothetical protein AM493_09315 [Flavobacterium akiainvivens]|uniref:Uncharacterized protein n=2 Tax=Flavobacterium akiainvivens TaxID=1202724 RepID=A0A0N0RQP1_9FLAO|nr:hypothetical protein AM493_09315 [Flavobacterium akiainvivens]